MELVNSGEQLHHVGYFYTIYTTTTVFELLMMGGLSLEACWTINKQWNWWILVNSCILLVIYIWFIHKHVCLTSSLSHVQFVSRPVCLTSSLSHVQFAHVFTEPGTHDRQSTCNNVEVLSCNHCCSGRAISTTYFECVFLTLVFQHANRMLHFVVCVLFDCTLFFHVIS